MKRDTKKQSLLRYGAAFVAAIFSASGIGCIMTWTSPALEYLKSPESPVHISETEMSWITPLFPVGSIIGYLMVPFLQKFMKQKWILLTFSIPQIVSWILIIVANNYIAIDIARILGGLGYAGGLCSLTIYLSEISSPHNRGIFLAFVQSFQSLGIFYILLLNHYFHYYYMNIIIVGTMSFFIFVFFFMPDSSYFNKEEKEVKEEEMVVLNGPLFWVSEKENLKIENENLKKNEDIDVTKKLLNKEDRTEYTCKKEDIYQKEDTNDFKIETGRKIKDKKTKKGKNEETTRNENQNLKEDMKINETSQLKINFIEGCEEKKNPPKMDCNSNKNVNSIISRLKASNYWKLISISANRKALIIVICCAAQEHFSGYSVLRVFTQQIFSYNQSFMSSEKSSLFLVTVKLIASIICTQIIERFNRKTILLYTGILASLGLTLTGFFFFLEYCQVDVSSFTWLPLFGIILYDFNFTIGITNFFFIYLGELFVGEIQGVAVTLCNVIYLIFIFITILLHQCLIKIMGIHVIFGIFALNTIVLCWIILKITPETKGKSLDEIQLLLKNKKFF